MKHSPGWYPFVLALLAIPYVVFTSLAQNETTEDPVQQKIGKDLVEGEVASEAEAKVEDLAKALKGKPEEPASKEPTSKEPTSKEPASEEPTSKEPTSEESTSEELTSKEPASEDADLEGAVVKEVEQQQVETFHAFNLSLPTENQELYTYPQDFYMHTNRYQDGVNIRPWQGGKYGFVRNPRFSSIGLIYSKLHEGVDIKPLYRGEYEVPLDRVCAIADGKVVHVSSNAWASSYGSYVVVEHKWTDGSFYSLYAHLAKASAQENTTVKAGDVLGILGDTGPGLNRERAHLHLELNFLMSEQFNRSWSPGDKHKNYNGLNMIGLDIARLYLEHKKNPDITIREFIAGEDPYFIVRSALAKVPGILRRHPWLGKNLEKAEAAKGWEFTFTRAGVPISIEPVDTYQKYAKVTWVKPHKVSHSFMTNNRIQGYGDEAYLTGKGHRFMALITESFF